MATDTHPFTTLTPTRIATAIESLGLWLAGEPFALNSYENRVFSFSDETRRRWVVKFYRPGRWSEAQIREEHAFLAELQHVGVPVAAPWQNERGDSLHQAHGFFFALFPQVPGQAPELEEPSHLFALGELIGRLHAQSQRQAFVTRPVLEPVSMARQSYEHVLAGNWLTARQRRAYMNIGNALLERLAGCEWSEASLIRVHGDCHLGNILGREAAFTLVDFDDCCMAPAVQDLWMLLTAEREDELRWQLSELIEGYEESLPFAREQLAWIEPLRTLRLMRYSAWLTARWEDPAFPRAFPWVASEEYWDQHLRILERQRVAMDEKARWLAVEC
jgi:Ser/Thr protein kinase RdoA (MazF antagonist)